MRDLKEDLSFKSKFDNRLQRIVNVLLLNASFIGNLGLLNGKMGIVIFFYHYARYTGIKIFEDYAGELIDEIYEGIDINTPADFSNGLTGIGWGIDYLIKNKFVEADTEEALAEIDNAVYKSSINEPLFINNSDDLFGYGFYFISRLQGLERSEENINALNKIKHLKYFTEHCERILVQKKHLDFDLKSLSVNTINSFSWFLLEMHRLGLSPEKVEKLFQSLPEYIELYLQDPDDISGQSLLLKLAENIILSVTDKDLKKTLKVILKKKDGKVIDTDSSEDIMFSHFIKNTWQQLIYKPYIKGNNQLQNTTKKIFSIIDNEENWNLRLDKLNKDNIGLTGFAGLGFGLLFEMMKEELGIEEEQLDVRHQGLGARD